MIEFLLSLPLWAGAVVAMLLTTVVGLLVYVIAYKLIAKYQHPDLKETAGSVFRVVGWLISLMLSLAFADAISEWTAVERANERDSAAIFDVFAGLQQFDTQESREIQTILVEYTMAVIDDDWPALARDSLSQRSGTLNRQLFQEVYALEPINTVQEQIQARILDDLDLISDHRLNRLVSALAGPSASAIVIIFGFLISMALFGVYKPSIPTVAFISMYTAFVGLVLYLILALGDPFLGDLNVETSTLEALVETMKSVNQ